MFTKPLSTTMIAGLFSSACDVKITKYKRKQYVSKRVHVSFYPYLEPGRMQTFIGKYNFWITPSVKTEHNRVKICLSDHALYYSVSALPTTQSQSHNLFPQVSNTVWLSTSSVIRNIYKGVFDQVQFLPGFCKVFQFSLKKQC